MVGVADTCTYILSLPSRRNQNQRKGRNGILESLPMTSQPHLGKRKVLGGRRDPHPSPPPCSAAAACLYPFLLCPCSSLCLVKICRDSQFLSCDVRNRGQVLLCWPIVPFPAVLSLHTDPSLPLP